MVVVQKDERVMGRKHLLPFNYTSNVSGTANVISGESTGAQYQNAPIDELRKIIGAPGATSGRVSLLENLSGVLPPFAATYNIYIDVQDSNKIKARSNISGYIFSTHATNADVVFQAVINDLTSGITIGTSTTPIPGAGDYLGLWYSGINGLIMVGPGLYTFYNGVKYFSHIKIQGAGRWATTIQWASGNILDNNNNNIFRSSMWDVNSVGASGVAAAQLRQGDNDVMFADLTIYGNYRFNVISGTNTRTSYVSGGLEWAGVSGWGHGIAHYGTRLRVDNVDVHGCPGAGIIIQSKDPTLGNGYPFPISADGTQVLYASGANGAGLFDTMSYITNCNSWANGRQGILIRETVFVNNYWSHFNGEAGIDVQSSDYFTGIAWIDGIECFLDGWQHGDQAATTYDSLGFEIRLLGGTWMSNAWIEAPYGPGDNLMIGSISGSAGITTSGYALYRGVNGVFINSLLTDSTRMHTIVIGAGTSNVKIRNARVKGNNNAGVITYSGITPLWVLSGPNEVELEWSGFNSGTTFITHGVILGISGVYSAQGNRLLLDSNNNDYVLSNQHVNNFNDIYCTLVDTTANTKQFIQSGSIALNYAKNSITINPVARWAGSSGFYKSHDGGTATFNGDGSTTVFTVSHGLFDAPYSLQVTPITTAAGGYTSGGFNTSGNGSGIIITYASAPVSGASNIKMYWNVAVTP